jgi:hypothetical protein
MIADMTKNTLRNCYNTLGVIFMKVKLFDEIHEKDLEDKMNEFLKEKKNEDIIDIKYEVAVMFDGRDQIYCYSAMILYKG